MKGYDTYSPSIPEQEEIKTEDRLPSAEEFFGRDKGEKKKKPKKNYSHKAKTRPGRDKAELKMADMVALPARIYKFFTSETVRMIFGLFLGCLAVYIGVSFISYFVTCVADQAAINNTEIGTAQGIENTGGEGGARLSEFLINECFGLGSFVIIIWLVGLSLKHLVGKPAFKTVNFTIKCLIALITVSLIIGLMTIGLNTEVNWGGFHGRYVNQFVINFLGWTGAVILCLFMIGCFVLICLRDVVKWISVKRAAYLEKKRIEREKREERLARERELEEMRRYEEFGEGYGIPEDEEHHSENEDKNVTFGQDETRVYEEIPDFDDLEYVIEDDSEDFGNSNDLRKDEKNSLDTVKEGEPDLTKTDEGIEEGLPDETDSVIAAQNEGIEKKTGINEESSVSSKNENSQEEENTLENVQQDGEEVTLEVNVNHISQTSAKRTVVSPLLPGSFPYKFPPYNLLAEGAARMIIDPDEQQENKDRIEKTLLDFKIPITSIRATIGPTVTLYEIVPDKGVKVASIKRLVDDIALSLSAEGVRIIAPIPGKGTVGIEVANKNPQIVSMQTVIRSKVFQENNYKLPVAIGSTISNEVYITDLAKMPHLLVAGATGQGKSVGLNAIIASLLYSKRPDELKFVMIDPKMVEFALYEKIEKHYLAKIPGAEEAIITDMSKAVETLNALVIEMEDRYKLLKDIHTKNIIEYNAKIMEGEANPADGHKFLPYIVVVVDEFADLILNIGKEVERPIARLAQKARAVGIHVIIATQRPSADVITGVIKGNFPARIAFKVASGIDSKTILDTTGAQYLIGKGDMLALDNSPLKRVQCAFINTPEVEAICDYISRQPYGQGAYILPEPARDQARDGEGVPSICEIDPYMIECARLVVSSNHGSTSSLQRNFSLGYNRAGKIMDQMEALGIVGPAQGGKPREVLVDSVALESILENLSVKK